MKTIRNSILAVLVIACATAVAATGVDMVVVHAGGGTAIVQTTGAPLGSYVEAVVTIDGMSYVVDAAPVSDATGDATVVFPYCGGTHVVLLRAPTGALILTSSYEGLTEND